VAISTIASPSWASWGEIEVYANGRNIALGRPVTASSSQDHTPADRVVDGDPNTLWNAGQFAPSTILIDLGAEYFIERVRLRVVQSPAGQTTHAVRLGITAETLTEAHRWIQYTREGDWLEYTAPINGSETATASDDTDRGRGMEWVRGHRMFVSGLSIATPAPTETHVATYFDEFNASAVHLWATGLPERMDAWRRAGGGGTPFVSWIQDDGTSPANGRLLGGYDANEPGRIGFQIGNSPQSLSALESVEGGFEAVRTHDRDALLYVNFAPRTGDLQSMLDHYAAMDADIVSYTSDATGRAVYTQAAMFRGAGLETGRPYWCYLPASLDPDTDAPRAPSQLRWKAFAHALLGYTGYSWLPYQSEPGLGTQTAFFDSPSVDATPTTTFATAAQINHELAHLGRALTQLNSTGIRYLAAESLAVPRHPENIPLWAPGAGGDPYLWSVSTGSPDQELALGFFVDEAGAHYFAVQNPNHVGGPPPTNSNSSATVNLAFQFPGDGTVDPVLLHTLDAITGDVETHDLTVGSQGAASLTFELAAGELRLLKYATGTPFALRD